MPRVHIAVFSRWRHQRNRINSVTGRLAQLVERTLSMREVEGSKPSLSTTFFLFLFPSIPFLFFSCLDFCDPSYLVFSSSSIFTSLQNTTSGYRLTSLGVTAHHHFDFFPTTTSAQWFTRHGYNWVSHHLVSIIWRHLVFSLTLPWPAFRFFIFSIPHPQIRTSPWYLIFCMARWHYNCVYRWWVEIVRRKVVSFMQRSCMY